MKERFMAGVARAIIACALFGTVAHAQQPVAASAVTVEAQVQPKSLVTPIPKARLADPSRIFNVALDRAPAAAMSKSAVTDSSTGIPLQIGFPRSVPGLGTSDATLAHLDWQMVSSGSRVAAFSVTSPDAQSLRVGLRIFAMPAAVLVRFYAPGYGEVFEASGAEIKATIERNLNAGEEGEDARTFWSPFIEGETAVVEVELPEGTSVDTFGIAAPTVSHVVTSPARNFDMPKAAAASCELDVVCYSQWSPESNAVARIAFTSGGSSFLCSGTLLADNIPATQLPFFLTANHCISTQASASSMTSRWFYRSTACDSGVPGAAVTLGGGATLLYASDVTDTSFMRLNSTPPGGAVYAGWQVGSIPALGASVTGIHHPGGDLQKISFGSLTSYDTCTPASAGQFTCRNASSVTGTFLEAAWSTGITEPGSSGSGIFLDNGHYLAGQLYGGTSSCTSPGSDFYGRFDVAYATALGPYLNGTATAPTPPPGSGVTGSPPSPPPPPAIVPALNYSALWWNAAESGWGVSLTQHNATLFAAWFVYDSNGNPRWVVMPGGTWTSTTSITGDLYSTSGPASVNDFDPALVSTQRVGSATFSFSNATNGVLTYTVNGVSGTKVITPQPFGAPDTTPTANYADLWWNSQESGWGLSISQQNRTLFAVWYAYGAFGQPQWYVMPGGTWSGNTYSGTLYRTTAAPAPFYGGAFDPKGVAVSVAGSMSLTFSGVGFATMSFTLDGVPGGLAITRQPF
jgi:lysyl endopeptidase